MNRVTACRAKHTLTRRYILCVPSFATAGQDQSHMRGLRARTHGPYTVIGRRLGGSMGRYRTITLHSMKIILPMTRSQDTHPSRGTRAWNIRQACYLRSTTALPLLAPHVAKHMWAIGAQRWITIMQLVAIQIMRIVGRLYDDTVLFAILDTGTVLQCAES